MKVSKREDPELWSLLSEKTLSGHRIAIDLLTDRGDEKGAEELRETVRLFEWLRKWCVKYLPVYNKERRENSFITLDGHVVSVGACYRGHIRDEDVYTPYVAVRNRQGDAHRTFWYRKNDVYEKIHDDKYVFYLLRKIENIILEYEYYEYHE